VTLQPSDEVGNLTIGEQQWVEIARALTDQARILILDEPNSALNQHETRVLFGLIERLKKQGITVLYISHRLEEVFQIADRITVIRDGEYVGTWQKGETTISEIVAAMVGRRTDLLFERRSGSQASVVLEVENMILPGRLQSVSFCVHAGEVVGLAGLVGSGVNDMLGALFGVEPAGDGSIKLDGKASHIRTPYQAMQHAIAMVPADRRGLGLMPNWSVLDNITFAVLGWLSRRGVIDHHRARQIGRKYIGDLHIVTDNLDKGVLRLSGGNQQKVLLARWLATNPRLLILEDPTRGIDVGAKREIYGLIDQVAADGVAVLFTSSEVEESLALCDRILVFRSGNIVAELPRHAFDKGLLTELMAGDLSAGQRTLSVRLAENGVADPATTTSGEPAAGGDKARQTVRRLRGTPMIGRLVAVREIGVLLAITLVFVLFSLLSPFFFTPSNLLLVTQQMAILGVITVGMTFVLAAGEVDLSVGWMFNMVMTVMALLMKNQGLDAWLTIPFG